jgi:acetolactate synthase I/II/III large subunit
LLNNSCNGLIRLHQKLGQQQTYGPTIEFGPVDFVGLARANGCEGIKVDHLAELQPALERAIALNRPTVIEIPVLYPNL